MKLILYYAYIFELVSIGIFSLEILLKLFVCELYYKDMSLLKAKLTYLTSFSAFIDLICIFSILLNFIPKQFSIIRLLKIFKLLRLVKISNLIKDSKEVSIDINKSDSKVQKVKHRVYEIVSNDKEGDLLSKIYDICSIIFISITLVILVLDTFDFGETFDNALLIVETCITVVFIIEYIARVWIAEYEFPNVSSDRAKMKYIFSFLALVDLLSILPIFFVGLPKETAIFKIFKIFKIVRLLKFSRYLTGIKLFGEAIKKKKKQILFSLVILVVMILLSSILLYAFENPVQPEVFSNGFSGLVFAATVLSSLGSSNIEIISVGGKIMVIIMMICGACVVGVPLGIISSEFSNMVEETDSNNKEIDVFDSLISKLTLKEKEEIVVRYLPNKIKDNSCTSNINVKENKE